MTPSAALHRFCRQEGLSLGRETPVLCAVSGGADSMALLHLLWKAGIPVTAATFHHGIRPTAGEDVAFVEGWCQARSIPCLTGRGDTPRAAQEQGETLEEAARRLRYAFLEEAAWEAGSLYIATAHTADDQAETILLRLLRGTGLKGLGAIPPRRGNIIRPLLSVTREEIEAYCLTHHIPWREDETNRDTRYTRNFLRQEVLPLLREKNPSIALTLAREAESLREDGAYLEGETDRAAARLLVREGERISLSARDLLALPRPIALRLLDRMAALAAPGAVLSQRQREGLLALAASSDPGGKLSLPLQLQGGRIYGMLVLQPKPPEGITFSPALLREGEEVCLPELGLSFRLERTVCPEGGRPNTLWLKPGKGPLLLRPRRTGDLFSPPGRPQKTLKKFLIDEKVPRARRDLLPVLDIDGTLAALWPFGPGSQYKALPGEECWQVTIYDEKEKEV